MKNKHIPAVEALHDGRNIRAEYLHIFFRVDFDTGKLYWKPREAKYFKLRRAFFGWNTRYAEKEAFVAFSHGYRHGALFDLRYPAHRIIWALKHGVWPENIDHVNGITGDNRLVNLRSVSQAENLRNTKRRSDNTSGVVGICWDKQREKWEAKIQVGGKTQHLGRFDLKESAVAARAQAEIKYGFHKNHGRD